LSDKSRISLVVADVDGTLISPEKLLTKRVRDAVAAVRSAGIAFAITSSRPPRGMAMFVRPLGLETPIGAFNGGVFAKPDLSIIEQHVLQPATARQTLDLMRARGLDVWVFSGNEWLVADANGPHVGRESVTVQFEPRVVPGFDDWLGNAAKLVGISDDHALVERCEAEAQRTLRGKASASRSQPYYLDVTATDANKGAVVDYLSRHLNVPRAEIATIGDSQNDLLMFRRSGLSIAMGNASDAIKAEADLVTASNAEDGFALAMERFILKQDSR
jgi:hypothetical protein